MKYNQHPFTFFFFTFSPFYGGDLPCLGCAEGKQGRRSWSVSLEHRCR